MSFNWLNERHLNWKNVQNINESLLRLFLFNKNINISCLGRTRRILEEILKPHSHSLLDTIFYYDFFMPSNDKNLDHRECNGIFLKKHFFSSNRFKNFLWLKPHFQQKLPSSAHQKNANNFFMSSTWKTRSILSSQKLLNNELIYYSSFQRMKLFSKEWNFFFLESNLIKDEPIND